MQYSVLSKEGSERREFLNSIVCGLSSILHVAFMTSLYACPMSSVYSNSIVYI